MRTETLEACRVLFGTDFEPLDLGELDPSRIRAAFRIKAKLHHPDRFGNAPPHVQRRQTELFQTMAAAYDTLLKLVRRQPSPTSRPSAVRSPRQRVSVVPPRAAPAHRHKPLPAVEMRLGTLLHYRGLISSQELAAALHWQAKSRTRIGEVALRWNWMTAAQVRAAAQFSGPLRFGERAIALGALEEQQLEKLLWYQRAQQPRLGTYFVERGRLAREIIDVAVGELLRHNARIRFGSR